jgi:arabinofuranan 3-O-arabinosyltransferase
MVVGGDRNVLRSGRVGPDGVLRFRPITTTQLKLRFYAASRRLQVTELIVPGVTPASRPEGIPFRLACGHGPELKINGKTIQSRVSGTYADLLEQRPVKFTGCAKAPLAAGDNRVRVPGWDPFSITNLVIGTLPEQPQTVEGGAAPGTWTQSLREVRVNAPKDSFLVVSENYNAGWRATLDGQALRPARIDGWKQAWELPAGTSGTVRLEYSPDRPYWLGLALGLAGIALLAVLSLVMRGPRPEHVLETAPASTSRLSHWRVPYVIVLGLLFGGWVANWPGMAVVLAAVAGGLWLRARRPAVHWVAAGLFGGATASLALAMALRDYARDVELLSDHIPQLLACAAMGVLFAQLVTEPEPPTAPAQPVREEEPVLTSAPSA